MNLIKTSIGFLGHVVNRKRTQPDQRKVKVVTEYPVPISITNVRAFLGLIGYYYNYVKGYSCIATPLFELTKKDNVFSWAP
jgi:hypothetical protein